MRSILLLGILQAPSHSDDPPAPEPPGRGWTVNHLMGSVVLSRSASDLVHRDGGVDFRPSLSLGCNPNRKVWVQLSGFMVGVETRNPVIIPMSLDGDRFVETGGYGEGMTVFFSPPKVFIRQILGHRRLVLRIHPYEETLSQDIHFELDGLDKIVVALFDACRWDPTKKTDKGELSDTP